MTIFPESKLAHQYLDGLFGLEIGAAAHNPFGLRTVNADVAGNAIYQDEQLRLCGKVAPVDHFIADASELPFDDKQFDFVISSHVLEHVYRPDLALSEWARVAKKYIFLIIPHKQRTFDRDREETTVGEIMSRKILRGEPPTDQHWNVWTPASFMDLVQAMVIFRIHEVVSIDDKVGNGFTVVLSDRDMLPSWD